MEVLTCCFVRHVVVARVRRTSGDIETWPWGYFGKSNPATRSYSWRVRLALLTFLLYWSFVLVRPFIPILAWSMVLTVALYPAYNWLSVRLGDRPKLAAVVITVINLAIIIGPVAWTGIGVIDGLQSFARQLGAATLAVPSPPDGVKDWPIIGARVYGLWDQAATNLGAVLREVAPHLKPLAGPVLAFASSAGMGTLKFIVSVALSGFLFLYGPSFVAATRRI